MSHYEKRIGLEQIIPPDEFLLDEATGCRARGPPLDFSLETCAHCDRGITIVALDAGDYEYAQLLCPACLKRAENRGLCPKCWALNHEDSKTTT